MTPSEFMNEYREMSVNLDSGFCVGVDVHSYLINHPGKHSAVKALSMWETIKVKLDRQLHDHWWTHSGQLVVSGGVQQLLGGGKGMQAPALRHAWESAESDLHHVEKGVRWVPYGKGSPKAVAEYLRLAVESGVATSASLQKFADDRYVGLDCSGFVSNYMVAIGKMKEAMVLESNARSFSVGHDKRMSLDDLTALDIMVWADGTHVAVIEDVASDSRKTSGLVVESNGHRGLDSEQYEFVSVDKEGVFTVKRKNGSEWKVRVFDWNL